MNKSKLINIIICLFFCIIAVVIYNFVNYANDLKEKDLIEKENEKYLCNFATKEEIKELETNFSKDLEIKFNYPSTLEIENYDFKINEIDMIIYIEGKCSASNFWGTIYHYDFCIIYKKNYIDGKLLLYDIILEEIN